MFKRTRWLSRGAARIETNNKLQTKDWMWHGGLDMPLCGTRPPRLAKMTGINLGASPEPLLPQQAAGYGTRERI
ncbi:MAG: hypothetical protein JW730_15515, partial [Anaerolineales bacterium]|nr:hypothetical protein [Anaerolineales bacterium]